ncbi:hypothetical protein F2A38_20705 [Pseudomonas chlororaphis]|uniref:Type III secretion protein n=1 Tax=Pseudomonas chlororaphis TaxID=587753 RepID=A0AB34C0S9_9PSED|nr:MULTISPECIES: hypothetical protein [Pseudomonas]KAA5839288.1 hypothetical protein F2A38_20705 [Pseudomonas chlororaphis]
MPCLKALSSPSRRDTSHIACDPRPDHQQQRDFDALLNPATPRSIPSTPSALEAAWPRHPRSALAQAFAPAIAQLRGLGRRHPGTLDLRLTNGPLAGLEIQASAQASLLSLNIKVADRDTFERIVGTRGSLENQLAAIFNRPVALTLQQLNGEPW